MEVVPECSRQTTLCAASVVDVRHPMLVNHSGLGFGLKMTLNAQIEEYLPTTSLSGFVVSTVYSLYENLALNEERGFLRVSRL